MTNGLVDLATDMPETQLSEGTPVDVRNRFVGSWSHGFEIADYNTSSLIYHKDRLLRPR